MKTKIITKVISVILSLALLSCFFIPTYAVLVEPTENLSIEVVEKDLETNEVEEKIYSSNDNGVSDVEIVDSWIDNSDDLFSNSSSNETVNNITFADPYSIIGGSDGRTKVASTKVHPYSAIVYLEIYFGLIKRVGTGFLISDNIVVTAGHCVYNQKYGWATSITVIPGKDGYSVFNDPYGVATSKRLGVSKEWHREGDTAYDWGTIKIVDSLVGNPGKIDIASIDNRTAAGTNINISGYPTSVNDKIVYSQYEMSGTINRATAYRFYYDIDVSGGQSGAPILNENNVAIGIHTAATETENTGIMFNDNVLYYLEQCVANIIG